VELDSFMFTSKNSKSCMERGLCDPIGGMSVWGSFQQDIATSKKKTVLSVVSFDATSLFHTKSYGAESDVKKISK
jgi:nicastrin